MKKINDIRHYKETIEALKRTKRNVHLTQAQAQNLDEMIERYERLLEYVENT